MTCRLITGDAKRDDGMVKQAESPATMQTAVVLRNNRICHEHCCLTLGVPTFAAARPGQFVHLARVADCAAHYALAGTSGFAVSESWVADCRAPLLRRAFSIAALRPHADMVEIDLIYRVVGSATRWMESLSKGDNASIVGPLGNGFAISRGKPDAYLVAGGVGLPPMLWLAEELRRADRNVVAFCGGRSANLLALTFNAGVDPDRHAMVAMHSCVEFARYDVPVVISTDDGSLGYHGHIGAAMVAYYQANPTPPNGLVVYSCGPERMMRFVAEYCMGKGIECNVCMERSMACGTGTCQSCVVPVRDESDAQGWGYRLCCTDGPVFDAQSVVWGSVA